MPGAPHTTRSEWPRIVIPVALGLLIWHAVNRFGLEIYPPDVSEGGRFRVIAYGSDANTARREQIGMFNRAYRAQGMKVDIVPNGSNPERIPTTSAAGNAPDILDCYPPEDLRLYIRKGIARPLNEHLKAAGIDLPAITWAARLDDLRVPNPDWKPGDHPLDRHIYYAVPNNMDVPMAWFNRTLYLRIRDERAARGLPTPPEPHLHWTWWDYAALGKVMHRRGADGRFLTFGASAPDRDLLVHQAALGLRGEDPAAFAALDPAERSRRGLDGLSWDEAASLHLRGPGGAWRAHPNRVALMQALQFDYDLVHALRAAPSSSDAQQMASVGGFASGGDLGRFKGGLQGLCIAGRWFVGQVRNDVSFDWRLLRLPRWVPYA